MVTTASRATPGGPAGGSVSGSRIATAVPAGHPSLGPIWSVLAGVADPEIPVVSVLDLGIVRKVAWDENVPGRLRVRVTPTYSGCPATELIVAEIRSALAGIGVADVEVEIALSPPWTTAFLSPAGQRKLRAYGITPPGEAAPARESRIDVRGISPLRRHGLVVPCPRCGSRDTELVAQFGSTACKAQYRCLACREPFDFFKPL